MSRIDSWHCKILTGRHFQNGRHNTAQIQHCPISTTFHMWIDYDVPNWFLWSKNFYRENSVDKLIKFHVINSFSLYRENSVDKLIKALEDLWETFLNSISSSVSDYLSVEHLGLILKRLAEQGTYLYTVKPALKCTSKYQITVYKGQPHFSH
jgi:hypothetical protein